MVSKLLCQVAPSVKGEVKEVLLFFDLKLHDTIREKGRKRAAPIRGLPKGVGLVEEEEASVIILCRNTRNSCRRSNHRPAKLFLHGILLVPC